MFGRLIFAFFLAISVSANFESQSCDEFVKAILESISSGDLASLPLPSIMYSGITSNNPGQKYQCQHKSGKSPYNYFLVDWKNNTNNLDTFTGICVPQQCNKQDIQRGLQQLSIKNGKVYDYPENASADALTIISAVFVGLWVGVLAVWSIIKSCSEPTQNQMIKKNEEVVTANDGEKPINSLVEQRVSEVKEDFKLFNFYQGYCRVFKRTAHKNVLSSILFLATLSIILSTEFSYRQTISANQVKSMKWFNSLGGVLLCNFQIAFSVIMLVIGIKLAYSLYKLSSFHQIGRFFFDQLLTKWAILVLTSMSAYLILSWTDQPLNQLWKANYGTDCHSTIYQIWFIFRTLTIGCKACLQWFWVVQVDILLTIIAAPFFIIFRTKRTLGYVLFLLIIFVSLIVGYAILDNQGIVFEPYKLFNMAKQFTISYQTNAIVRMAPYFMGLMFGLLINQGLEKTQNQQNTSEPKLAKKIRRNQKIQIALHIIGLALMITTYLLIIPYLTIIELGQARTDAYAYLLLAPFGFILGLLLFLLPCFWQGESKLTVFINRLLGMRLWNSLQKMSIGFLLIGPVVIGFTTYSMQNSIYFDFETVFVYFLGDAVIIYILTLLAVSAIDNQLHSISKWMQAKFFGNESKYSVLVIQD